MPGHDMITIGTSAGGLEALKTIVGMLPRDIPAAIFVVQHVAATGPSLLPQILSRANSLPAAHATDGTPIRHGQIYVAPPDHHMLIRQGHLHTVRGPKENLFRPAIDATFRTAARAYGPQVVGVILTGMLDDGTAGMLAIKRRGGTAIVQDPAEAAYPSMPESACRYVAVDTVLSVAEIAPRLLRLANEPVKLEGAVPMPEDMDPEANISGMDSEAIEHSNTVGATAPLSCPDCGGVLVEYYDGDLLRFRCQVGHAYSRESLYAGQSDMLDRSLWNAFSALDERAYLAGRLAQDARALNDPMSAERFTRLKQQAETQKERVRLMLLKESGAEIDAGDEGVQC